MAYDNGFETKRTEYPGDIDAIEDCGVKGDMGDTASGLHFDADKLRYDLIPPEVEKALAEVLTYGCEKYAPRNWEKGIAYMRLYASVRRHLAEWMIGRDLDDESGLPHLWHVLTDIAFLITYDERLMGELDDRPAEAFPD